MKIFKINSIAFQLVVIILIISIMPVMIITYNTSVSISQMEESQFKERLDNIGVISDQSYTSRLDKDNTLASIMANDYGLQTALLARDKLTTKRIIDRYSRSYPDISIVVVTNESGTQVATSSSSNVAGKISNDFLDSALTGKGMSGIDIVPESIIEENYLGYKTLISGTTDGLGIYSAQPIKDDENNIVGAVMVIDLLNDNTELVDQIAADTGGVCSVYMGDIRIATTMRDNRDIRLHGSKADTSIITGVTESGTKYEAYEDFKGQHLYTVYQPLRNPEGQIVGIIATGYDVNPLVAQSQKLTAISIATGLFIAIISAIIGLFFVRTITNPIYRLVKAADRVASGDLDTPLAFGKESDEITDLLNSIRTMVSSIKDRISYNESVLRGISDPMLVIDNNEQIILFNEAASKLTGYAAGEAMEKTYIDLLGKSCDSGAAIRDAVKSQALVHSFEDTIMLRDGRKVILLCSSAPIKDAGDRIIGTLLLLRNITRKKEAERQIAASLREKELLLKEIHHRVKNNLQVISSLLSLQSAYITDRHAQTMFRESQNRVKSMALIHERLYQSSDFAHIDIGEYLQKLASSLSYTYGPVSRNIKITIDSADVSLGIDTAIPCGLIINELLSNAFKYAFPDGRPGEIMITFGRVDQEKSRYRLVVRDNGVGIDSGLSIENTKTLGLQLVHTLTEQLNGKIILKREGGTEFEIVFSESTVQTMQD